MVTIKISIGSGIGKSKVEELLFQVDVDDEEEAEKMVRKALDGWGLGKLGTNDGSTALRVVAPTTIGNSWLDDVLNKFLPTDNLVVRGRG